MARRPNGRFSTEKTRCNPRRRNWWSRHRPSPGAEYTFTFKTVADALLLRNHLIERFERADVETDPRRKAQILTFVVIGGGLVGVELLGELTAFVDGITPLYKNVDRGEVRFLLLHAADRVMPEIDPTLADHGARVLAGRPGSSCGSTPWCGPLSRARSASRTKPSPPTRSFWRQGLSPTRWWPACPSRRTGAGASWSSRHCAAEVTRRCGHWVIVPRSPALTRSPTPAWPSTPCVRPASWPGTSSGAGGWRAAGPPRPFVYRTLGMMGSLGHGRGFGQLLKVRVYGLPAWFVRRTYYLLQTPGWGRRLRIVIDWTFALLFRPDVVKVGLDSETALLLREVACDAAA